MTRYASATGHHVTRRFGWDCHGLPVEFEIDKKLGVTCREDVLAMGIGVYNEECRSIVMRYSKEWEATVRRVGRWIDFRNDYKTLDPAFMESVWCAARPAPHPASVPHAGRAMLSACVNGSESDFGPDMTGQRCPLLGYRPGGAAGRPSERERPERAPPHARRWVFKSLHEKGLVYRGFKVMPYSTRCNTPLSNFEAGLDYRDVPDPAIMARAPPPPPRLQRAVADRGMMETSGHMPHARRTYTWATHVAP